MGSSWAQDSATWAQVWPLSGQPGVKLGPTRANYAASTRQERWFLPLFQFPRFFCFDGCSRRQMPPHRTKLRMLSPTCAQTCPSCAMLGPSWSQVGPKLETTGRSSAQVRPKLGAMMAKLGWAWLGQVGPLSSLCYSLGASGSRREATRILNSSPCWSGIFPTLDLLTRMGCGLAKLLGRPAQLVNLINENNRIRALRGLETPQQQSATEEWQVELMAHCWILLMLLTHRPERPEGGWGLYGFCTS